MGQTANIVGTDRSDRIGGTQNRDVIVARGGADRIIGRGGNDLICTGGGNDQVNGQGGSDRILGGKGLDLIFGGKGNDTLKTGPGVLHVLFGGAGNDRLVGNRLLAIAAYEDSPKGVRVNLARNRVTGYGRDRLRRINIVTGSKQDDTMRGDGGSNILLGSAGNDVIRSGGNRGSLGGLTGLGIRTVLAFDIIDGDGVHDAGDLREPGNDTLSGGAGLTVANYASSTGPVDVDLNRGIATGQGRDRLDRIQLVAGSFFDDTLRGNNGANAFEAEAGADDVDGRAGPDTIVYVDAASVDADLTAGTAVATYRIFGPSGRRRTPRPTSCAGSRTSSVHRVMTTS